MVHCNSRLFYDCSKYILIVLGSGNSGGGPTQRRSRHGSSQSGGSNCRVIRECGRFIVAAGLGAATTMAALTVQIVLVPAKKRCATQAKRHWLGLRSNFEQRLHVWKNIVHRPRAAGTTCVAAVGLCALLCHTYRSC